MKSTIDLDMTRNRAQLRTVAPALVFALFVLAGGWAVAVLAPGPLIAGAALAAVVLGIPLTTITYWLRRREASEHVR